MNLYTPRAITNNVGSTVWKWDNIDPFGKNVPTNLGIDFNLRFSGQYSDSETGLFYNYFRYYNPITGRYIKPDSIGLAGGFDLYAYVGQNPINFVDPWKEHFSIGKYCENCSTYFHTKIPERPNMGVLK